MSLHFTKMHGLGNDFMVINNLDGKLILSPSRIQDWSDRHTGIGFDQLLVVNESTHKDAEFDYQIFNASGEEVEHCGNGARCFAKYVSDNNLTTHRSINVNTTNGLITLHLQQDGEVTVAMGVPTFAPSTVPFLAEHDQQFHTLDVDGQEIQVGVAAIGNPHVLLQVDDIHQAPVSKMGPLIESHERFPQRVNVSFMQIIDRQQVKLRVYERSVGETRACGSGACAAVAIAHRQNLLDKNVQVTLPGGDLKVYWPNIHSSIEMTGPCSTVFEGQTNM